MYRTIAKITKIVENRENPSASVFIVTFISEIRVCGNDEGRFTRLFDELNRVVRSVFLHLQQRACGPGRSEILSDAPRYVEIPNLGT